MSAALVSGLCALCRRATRRQIPNALGELSLCPHVVVCFVACRTCLSFSPERGLPGWGGARYTTLINVDAIDSIRLAFPILAQSRFGPSWTPRDQRPKASTRQRHGRLPFAVLLCISHPI